MKRNLFLKWFKRRKRPPTRRGIEIMLLKSKQKLNTGGIER